VVFAILRGPVPHVHETFELLERDGVTTLTYQGTVGATSGCSGSGTGAAS
jgi:hypothetical protein